MGSVKQSGTLDSTLGAIVAHPLRGRCLTILSDRTASPNELARDLGEDVGNVSYHVKQLLKMEVIELVRERPVRGAVEHFYRAIQRPVMDEEEYEALPVEKQLRFARLALQFCVADAATSIETNTFTQRPNHHLTRLPVMVDEEGWQELGAAYREAYERTIEIEAASARRTSESQADTRFPARVISMFFEMPRRNQD